MLVAAMFLVALVTISLAAAAPILKKEIQRDREEETMHRGKQYIRAIQLYYRKFHAYPPNLDALQDTQQIRFLRKKYVDPITGKDDWTPVAFGQNKAPTAMGLFNQPLGSSSIAGTGPGGSGGNGLNGTGSTDPNAQNGSGSSTGNSSFFNSNQGSSFNNQNSSIFGNQNQNGSGIFSNSGSNGSNGSNGSSTDPNAPGGGSSGGLSGQTFGGAGVIGFSPVGEKQSILIYKKKTHYNEWEFVYDPIADLSTMGAGGAGSGAQPLNGAGTGSGSSPFGNSNNNNNSPFGNSNNNNSPFGNQNNNNNSPFNNQNNPPTNSNPTPQTPPQQ